MKLSVDFCVVGGGIAGLCAALSASRHGARVALVQDRPVLGGNASSEIRMHICGAHGPNRRETGIVEEIFLENYRYNAFPSWPVFDSILWGMATREKNLTLVLDASVNSLEMDGNRIRSVRAWQTTTSEWIEVEATMFADCSGDGVLAPLSGAAFRMGREGRDEFGESEAPEKADACTMGNSILMQATERPTPQPFTPMPWAYDFSKADLEVFAKSRGSDVRYSNWWWIEVGGLGNAMKDVEENRGELLKIAYGIWDWVKNHGPQKEENKNWALEWVGSLPGKRESRRYEGAHMLVQQEVQKGDGFDDVVAYGGWLIDNHYPAGFFHRGNDGTKYTKCPSPFQIPLRCLYSRNVANLWFAGRDVSCSHVAMSATRVMATCGLMGQAVGTAVAIATAKGYADCAEVYEKSLAELQSALEEDDCFLPMRRRAIGALCAAASLAGEGEGVERLRDGMDRDWDDGDHGWRAALGAAATYTFAAPAALGEARLVFDSDLNRRESGRPYKNENESRKQGRFYRALADNGYAPPETLVRDFRVEVQDAATGAWRVAAEVKDNHQRLVRVPLAAAASVKAARLVPTRTWGAPAAHVFAFEVR